MKFFCLMAVLAVLMGVGVSCGNIGGDEGDNPYKKLNLTTKSEEYVKQGTGFAFEFIDRILASEPGDFFISPLSMQFLLGMLLNGAHSLLDSYKSTVGKSYKAEVANLDFSKNAASLKTINGWCDKQTNGMIPQVLDEVNPNMLAYLLNALYFKSEWKEKFSKSNTGSEPFAAGDGTKKKVPMMKKEGSFLYQDNDVFRVVSLPYGNGAFRMLVVLPQSGKNLADVSAALKAADWDQFLHSMVSCDVDLWLPKFETKYSKRLNEILSAMGMPSSFSPLADFKAMSPAALCLSFVKQDTAIKVDEEGTEAAAISTAGMMATAAAPGQHVVFHADQPFLYLITENSTGAILFAGKYAKVK